MTRQKYHMTKKSNSVRDRILFFFLCRAIIVTLLLVIFFLICVKLGFLSYFQILLSKVGFFFGQRALSFFLMKMGCSGALALAIGFAVKALLATEVAPYLANLVLPAGAGAEPNVNPAPGRNDAGPANVVPDDTNEPHNLPNGYWSLRRILIDSLKADMDTSFDRTPSYRKYQRVLELLAGPHYTSKARIVELLQDIANNPVENPTRERARQIIHDIYEKRVKDKDLHHYEFNDNAGQSFLLMN